MVMTGVFVFGQDQTNRMMAKVDIEAEAWIVMTTGWKLTESVGEVPVLHNTTTHIPSEPASVRRRLVPLNLPGALTKLLKTVLLA
jgi:hypothetical protein